MHRPDRPLAAATALSEPPPGERSPWGVLCSPEDLRGVSDWMHEAASRARGRAACCPVSVSRSRAVVAYTGIVEGALRCRSSVCDEPFGDAPLPWGASCSRETAKVVGSATSRSVSPVEAALPSRSRGGGSLRPKGAGRASELPGGLDARSRFSQLPG